MGGTGRIAAYYWWIYPNMMMNIYPWGVSMNMIVPTSVNTTKVLFKSYVQNPELLNKGAGALLDKVELQDQTVVEGCMRGLQSKLYHRGRYSATHEKGVHHTGGRYNHEHIMVILSWCYHVRIRGSSRPIMTNCP